MNFFRHFPTVAYRFGNAASTLGRQAFQNLSVYSDVIDQIKDSITTYQYYNILEGDRPDQLSKKLYGRPDLHWTFWLMNDHIRESGWPLGRYEMDDLLAARHPGVAIVTRDKFWGELPESSNVPGPTLNVGDVLTGSASGTSATVTDLDANNGQIFLDGSSLFNAGEAATWTDENEVLQTIVVQASTTIANSIHHIEDADGFYVDYDPTVGPGALYNEVTLKDMYIRRNEELREIRIIDPKFVEQIVRQYTISLQD